MIKRIFAVILAAVMLASCTGAKENPAADPAADPAALKQFYYQDTKWGMTTDDIIKTKGEPAHRSDVKSENSEFDNAIPITGEETESKNIDFFYEGQSVYEKYTAETQYMFTEDKLLAGVIDIIDIGTVKDDLTNLDEVRANGIESYKDIKAKLVAKYGEPAVEYTAYQKGDEYNTEEKLDLENEDTFICTSRWDGDDYRFLYIMFFKGDCMLDVRYIPHDKETVDAQKNLQK